MNAYIAKLQIENEAQVDAIIACVIFIANLAGAYVCFAPLDLQMPNYGLDPSWSAVLSEAATHKWIFGRDIIFTGGPLSAVYTHYFQLESFAHYVAINVFLIVAFALLVTTLALQSRRLIAGMLTAVGLLVLDSRDASFIAFPLLVAILSISADRGTVQKMATGIGLLACSLVSLAKFSVFPMAVVSFILVDIACVIRHRWAVHTIGFVLFYFAVFAWLEGTGPFLQYISDSLNLSSGYSEAMFLTGARSELVIFLAGGILLLATIGYCELRAIAGGAVEGSIALVRWLIVAIYLFVVFKAGFVRHDDLHSPIAWSGLAVAALVYPGSQRAVTFGATLLCPAIAALALLVAIPAVYDYWGALFTYHPHQSFSTTLRAIPERIEQRFSQALSFIMRPAQQVADLQRAKEEAWEHVRAARRMPHIDGSIDSIPSIQSSLLAYGLDYRPRYTIQEYTTYTRRLIEANLRGMIERGPTYLLFRPGSIDGRHPAMVEGPLWPYILSAYEPASREGELLVLRHRAQPLGNILGDAVSQTTTFGDVITIPDVTEPEFLVAKIRKTLFGRLVDFLFRLPLVEMKLTYSDSSQQSYRVVPAIAESGFFVSPLISNSDDFLLIARGETGHLPRVKNITFETNEFGQYVYASSIDILLRPLSLAILKQATRNTSTVRLLGSSH